MELFESYPFLPSMSNYFPEIKGLDVKQFLNKVFGKYNEEIMDRLKIFFDTLFSNKEYIDNYKFDKLNTYLYLFLRIVIHYLNDKMLSNKIANLYSKICYRRMRYDSDANVFEVCNELNMDIKYKAVPIIYSQYTEVEKEDNTKEVKYIDLKTNFIVHFTTYLKYSKLMRDEKKLLQFQTVKDGYVYVSKKGLVRLIQEKIKEKILKFRIDDKRKEVEQEKLKILENQQFANFINSILEQWENYKPVYKNTSLDIEHEKVRDFVPPCVNDIWTRSIDGVNLTHTERLIITFFLSSLDLDLEDIKELFKTMPDYNEQKTEYQIKHAQKREYMPHNCRTIQTLGLCSAEIYNDELCLKGYYAKQDAKQKLIKNPLSYARIKKYRSERKSKNND